MELMLETKNDELRFIEMEEDDTTGVYKREKSKPKLSIII